MIYDLSNPHDAERFKKRANELYASKSVAELKRRSPQRSMPQNKYLHVILGYFGSEYGMSLDEVKVDIFKRLCNGDLFIREVENKKGEKVKRLRSSADLSTAEMTVAIERFRNWAASVAEIYLPSPDERGFLLHAEKVIEKDKQFL